MTLTRLAEITASHARIVTADQLEGFVNQLAAREPKAGTADHVRLETYAAELRGRVPLADDGRAPVSRPEYRRDADFLQTVSRALLLLVCIGSLFAMAPAHAGNRPKLVKALATLDAGATVYGSLDHAARAALALAVVNSKEFEYGGVIVKCADGYRHTMPVTSGSPTDVWYDVHYPSTCSIAAIYHTHPGRDTRVRLSLSIDSHARAHSRNDIATARRLGVPSYIAVVSTGEVLVLRGAK